MQAYHVGSIGDVTDLVPLLLELGGHRACAGHGHDAAPDTHQPIQERPPGCISLAVSKPFIVVSLLPVKQLLPERHMYN